jgi:hypothetical protein
MFRSGRESDSDAEDVEHIEKLRQVKAVLEEVFSNCPHLCANNIFSVMLNISFLVHI